MTNEELLRSLSHGDDIEAMQRAHDEFERAAKRLQKTADKVFELLEELGTDPTYYSDHAYDDAEATDFCEEPELTWLIVTRTLSDEADESSIPEKSSID